MVKFTRILFPVSLTDMSPVVVPYVTSMAEKYTAEIHMVHVVRKMTFYADSVVHQPSETDIKSHVSNFEKDSLHMAEKQLKAFKEKFVDVCFGCKLHIECGTHYKRIIGYAEQNDIDLIIM